MNYDDLFPSNYLKASDVEHQPVVTIRNIARETMKNKQGKEELKPVLFFDEFEKGVVLNKTNGDIICDLYGKDLNEWIGARIQLQSAMVEAFGERKPAIRVVEKKPAADKATVMDRYQKLWERGKKAGVEGIEDYVINPNMDAQEIIALGKELKAKVEAAEQF